MGKHYAIIYIFYSHNEETGGRKISKKYSRQSDKSMFCVLKPENPSVALYCKSAKIVFKSNHGEVFKSQYRCYDFTTLLVRNSKEVL